MCGKKFHGTNGYEFYWAATPIFHRCFNLVLVVFHVTSTKGRFRLAGRSAFTSRFVMLRIITSPRWSRSYRGIISRHSLIFVTWFSSRRHNERSVKNEIYFSEMNHLKLPQCLRTKNKFFISFPYKWMLSKIRLEFVEYFKSNVN